MLTYQRPDGTTYTLATSCDACVHLHRERKHPAESCPFRTEYPCQGFELDLVATAGDNPNTPAVSSGANAATLSPRGARRSVISVRESMGRLGPLCVLAELIRVNFDRLSADRIRRIELAMRHAARRAGMPVNEAHVVAAIHSPWKGRG